MMFAALYDLIVGRAHGSPTDDQAVFERVVPTGRLQAKRGGKDAPLQSEDRRGRDTREKGRSIKLRDGKNSE